MMSCSHVRSSVDTIPIVSQMPIHSTLFRVESIPLNANAQPGEPKSRRSVPSCASTAVLQMLPPHEVTTAVALGLSLVFLARQAVGLACLLVDGLFLLGLQLGVNLGTLGGLVAVDLGLLRLCQRNALDSHRVSGSIIREEWGPSWTMRSPYHPWAHRPSSPRRPDGWRWIAGPLWSWSVMFRQAKSGWEMSLTGVVRVVRVDLAFLVALAVLELRVLDVALVTSAVDADGAYRRCASHGGGGGERNGFEDLRWWNSCL